MSGTMRSLEDLTEQQILAMLNPAEPRARAGNPGAEMLRQMYLPPPQEPISYDALRERLSQLRPMNVTNPPGATMPLGMQEPESTPEVLGTPQSPLTPAQQTIAGQPPAALPPLQEVTVRPQPPVSSVPAYQTPAPPQQAAALPAPVPAQQAAPAPAASSGVSGNTLLGLAAITDAFAILGGRQPTMLAQMAPIAQQRSQQQALTQIIQQRMQGALSPQQATILGNAVQQAGAAAGGGAPQAAGGEAPYGGGFSARGLAINTQIESGGNATAQNPRSSAFGANQFIASTWNEFARANPDLFRGMSQEEILSSRSNPELSAQATQWNARRNSEVLSNANLPVNDATLGVAHMFGPQGAVQLLRSSPTARMEDVVSADVLRANPNLAGRTVGDVAGEFGRRYAPAALTPEQRAIAAPTAAAPGAGAPGTALRPRGVEMTPQLAATLQALPPAEALKLLTQLDLQAAQQRGTRILSGAESRSILGEAYDPDKVYQLTQEGGITVVPGTRESQAPTRQQQVSLEGELRTQFGAQKPVQEFLQMGPQIRAIRDGVARETPSRLNDINLTFAFAKMLDPTSVVRENEAGQIVASASVMDRLGGFIARLNGGAAFSPELRAQLLREAESRYSSAREAYDVEADAYRDLARGYGVEPGRVIPPRRDLSEAQPIPRRGEQVVRPIAEGQRQGAVDFLRNQVSAGRMTRVQAIQEARNSGIPNAERLFQ
jgi:hypothetical protein